MPTYEYRCFKCGKRFDYFQKMSDKPIARCVHCKGKVERLIGAGAGLIFKGSGFYETDYKRKPESPKSPKPAEAKTPAKEKKPEKKKEKD